jgi:Flp pilus assembly protein protease CpaA
MIVIIMGHVIMAVVHVIRDGKEMTAPNKIVTTVIQIVVKITVYASIKPLVSRVVVNYIVTTVV